MKKFLTIIFGAGCFTAMMLSGASKADGSCSTPWSLGCIVVAVVCGLLLIKINPDFKKGGLMR